MAEELALSLPRQDRAGGLARSAIRARFGERLGHVRTADLSLVTTELIANAVVHGRGAITLRVRLDGDRVFGEVVDEGGGFERKAREAGTEEPGGRGLLIVESLAHRWGVHEGTTHVWFELARQEASRGRREPELGDEERPDELDAQP